MGAAQSSDNDDLVDYLVNNKFLRSKRVEVAMRLVDRGRFLPKRFRGEAYKDSPLKVDDGVLGQVHLSAPCIYANVLEALSFEDGHSFLNIGSGSGWLNTVAGFLIGSSGVNHGVEIHSNLVEYSKDKLKQVIRGPEVSVYDWAEPSFFHGNGLSVSLADDTGYDRIYCGAALPEANIPSIIKLLKIGGSMVTPVETRLSLCKRISETEHSRTNISTVQFADLIMPLEGSPTFSLPSLTGPFSLKMICREVIRGHLRKYSIEKSPIEMRQLAKDVPLDETRMPPPRVMLRVDWPNGRREEVHAPFDLDDANAPVDDDAIRIRLMAANDGEPRNDGDNRAHSQDLRRWRILERLLGRTAAARRELRNMRRQMEVGEEVGQRERLRDTDDDREDANDENGEEEHEEDRDNEDNRDDEQREIERDTDSQSDDGHLIFSDDTDEDGDGDDDPFLDQGTPDGGEHTGEESMEGGGSAEASEETRSGTHKRRRIASSNEEDTRDQKEDVESKRRRIARERQATSIRECGRIFDRALNVLALSNNMKTYCRLGAPLPSNLEM